ncbi:uncharacterized protein TNCV_2316471 [Trichonephila clavipes]|nr:uncharacterized protein TNCV_2316471 [Trichonephila clavipes]
MAYSDFEKAEAFKDTLEVTFQENVEPYSDDKIEEVENVVCNYFDNFTTLTPPLTSPIEVRGIIKRLQNRKAAGPDQIPNIALKYLTPLRNGRPRVHDLCCSINICDFYAIHSEGKGVGSGCSVIGFLLRCPGKKELLFLLSLVVEGNNDMVYDCLFERLVPELEFPSSLTAKERFG